MFSRASAITASASRLGASQIRSKSTKSKPLITSYPVSLKFQYPSWDIPAIITFKSKKHIEVFLSEKKQFLLDAKTGNAVLPDQTEKIDPTITYDIVGAWS
jgi:hypothetical protein